MFITDEDRLRINSGVEKVFIWGGADYTDAFKRKHFYRFQATNNENAVLALNGLWSLAAEGEEGD
jgi:hypothetical protein